MNKFLLLSDDERDEIKSSFLIDSISQSRIASFQRNELAFAKRYIYSEFDTLKSVSSIVGSAYHKMLEVFFENIRDGKPELSIEEATDIAAKYISEVSAADWKQGKTYKTIETLQNEALKQVSNLVKFFLEQSNIYTDDIQEIIFSDEKFESYVVLNGVDVPLPMVFIPDLVYIDKNGELAILDHKSTKKYTTEEEVTYKYATQAITYIVGIESMIDSVFFQDICKRFPKAKEGVKNFHFYENKSSVNSKGVNAGLSQIQKIDIPVTDDNRRLYEALLYEPLKRMLEATSNPDYIYLMNPSDIFLNEEQRAELLDFWVRMQSAEIEEFSINSNQKNILERRTKKTRDSSIKNVSPEAIKKFKKDANKFITYSNMEEKTPSDRIRLRLQTLGISINVAHEEQGYSCNTYLLEISAGIKLQKVLGYSLDIANALGVSDVIISNELRVWNGKSYVEVQVPNLERKFISHPKGASGLNIELGLDNFGEKLNWDLENPSTPHGIICGATGSGKSVCLETILKSVRGHYDELYIFDPKFEFDNSINDIDDIEEAVLGLVYKMEELVKARKKSRVIIIFDELADALMQSKSNGGMIAENIQKILQKGRSVGFNVIAATQRASAKVLSGDALVNFPVRIAFRTPKQIDSQVILGEPGAERLTGKGDGLFLSGETPSPVRFQGYFE